MKYLALKIPPLLLVMIFSAAMFGLSKILPNLGLSSSLRWMILLIMSVISSVIVIASTWCFKVTHTTVNPFNPDSSTSLIQSGIYRYSRNPMYLGFTCFLIGIGVWLDSLFSILLVPTFIGYLTVFQIRPEEEALSKIFGDDFNQYKIKTNRWL